MYDDKDYNNNVHQHEDAVFYVNNNYTDKLLPSFYEKKSKFDINSSDKNVVSIFENKRDLGHDNTHNELK